MSFLTRKLGDLRKFETEGRQQKVVLEYLNPKYDLSFGVAKATPWGGVEPSLLSLPGNKHITSEQPKTYPCKKAKTVLVFPEILSKSYL